MSNLNTNYENMKKYKFETLFIKKSNLNMKIPVWNMTYEKYQAPLSYWLLLCSVRSRCLGPLWTENFGPGWHQWAKNTRVLMKHPWGECSKLLVDWVLGPMAGEMWVNRVAVVMIPVRPGTLTTATRVTQHTPTFGPRTQSTGNRGTPPQGGCQQTPNASTTEATWARV